MNLKESTRVPDRMFDIFHELEYSELRMVITTIAHTEKEHVNQWDTSINSLVFHSNLSKPSVYKALNGLIIKKIISVEKSGKKLSIYFDFDDALKNFFKNKLV